MGVLDSIHENLAKSLYLCSNLLNIPCICVCQLNHRNTSIHICNWMHVISMYYICILLLGYCFVFTRVFSQPATGLRKNMGRQGEYEGQCKPIHVIMYKYLPTVCTSLTWADAKIQPNSKTANVINRNEHVNDGKTLLDNMVFLLLSSTITDNSFHYYRCYNYVARKV